MSCTLGTNRINEIESDHCVGAECHLIVPAEIARLHPLLDTEGMLLGVYTPGDGHTDSADCTMALAAFARRGVAGIKLRDRVVDIVRSPGGDWGTRETAGVNSKTSEIWKKVKSWFGYGLHLIADIHYNVPVVLEVTRASRSETTVLTEMPEEVFGNGT